MHRLPALAVLLTACLGLAQTRAEKEQFLKSASIVAVRPAGSGVTGSLRATLDDGQRKHDAHIQTHDEYQQSFRTSQGVMLNFKDSWKYNLAAYKVDQLLGLNMIPVTVEREYKGKTGSFTWWVDDVVMNEEARVNKGQRPPDLVAYSHQVYTVRVFDELIYNFDRNLGNLLIDKDWQIWMIDHTRAFRPESDLKHQGNLVRCDRAMLERMNQLNEAALQRELAPYATKDEIRALLARRDKIVAALNAKGPDGMFESPRRP